jgi:hypothetical protein
MEIAGWAGIWASLLGLALTIYGVFYNGWANRMLMRSIEADIQTARAHIESFQAQADRQHEATRALIESFQAQTARQHENAQALLAAIQADIQTTRNLIESFQAQALRQHEDLIAFLREMDRRHTEIMARLGELLITSRK